MTPTHLITHNGGFHADEVMSTVVLSALFPKANIVRTRDTDWTQPAPGRIIYDVGGDFDPARFIFDHHQRGAPVRPDGQPFSSFGLIWRAFGADYLAACGVPEADSAAVHAAVDETFVLPVDLVDNGVVSPAEAGPLAAMTLPGLIETLKPVFDDPDPEAEMAAFHRAVTVARPFVEAQVAGAWARRRASGMVVQAIAAADGAVLELPRAMPFEAEVRAADAPHLLFAIYPRGTDWALSGIKLRDQGYDLRADLPAGWAGLTDAALEAACGVPGAVFCHKARFMAVARTRAAILAMAEIAVREAQA